MHRNNDIGFSSKIRRVCSHKARKNGHDRQSRDSRFDTTFFVPVCNRWLATI